MCLFFSCGHLAKARIVRKIFNEANVLKCCKFSIKRYFIKTFEAFLIESIFLKEQITTTTTEDKKKRLIIQKREIK